MGLVPAYYTTSGSRKHFKLAVNQSEPEQFRLI